MRDIFLICHNIRSLHNVGAIFRNADAFGVSKIYLTGYTGSPVDRLGTLRKEVEKTALGAQDSVPWEKTSRIGPLLATLKKKGVYIVALEHTRNAWPLPRFQPRFPVALILGNEVTGIPSRILREAHATVNIPMHGKKESLNVAVACGVALYQLRSTSR